MYTSSMKSFDRYEAVNTIKIKNVISSLLIFFTQFITTSYLCSERPGTIVLVKLIKISYIGTLSQYRIPFIQGSLYIYTMYIYFCLFNK